MKGSSGSVHKAECLTCRQFPKSLLFLSKATVNQAFDGFRNGIGYYYFSLVKASVYKARLGLSMMNHGIVEYHLARGNCNKRWELVGYIMGLYLTYYLIPWVSC